jgi:polar amino acid transport system substrate-binding protein
MTKHSLRKGVVVVAATALALVASGATSAARPASTAPESTVPSSSAPAGSAAPGSTMAPGALADLLPPEIAAAGELKVATSLYPPVTFYEEDGETLTGFDYEITEAIGGRLGVDIDWNVIDFANIMPGIESGQYDFATDLNDTAEREEVVDFVTEFRDGTSIMVPTGNPDSIAALEDLCGRTVVVTSGSTQVDLANTQSTACTDGGGDALDLLEVPDDPDAMLAMNSGRADAYLVNTLAGSYAANTSDNADVELIDGVYDQVFAGFVFPKDSSVLRDAVLAAMQSLIDDGTYAEVMSSYGLENNMIESSVVNAAGS